jgi:four helix bundle protein
LCDQLERAARNAPRAVAEGFGRYLPADFIRYLRYANGEVKEVLDALQDAVDRRYVSPEQILPLQRLAKRSTRAIGGFIAYLRTSTPPNESGRPARNRTDAAKSDENPRRRSRAAEPQEPQEP